MTVGNIADMVGRMRAVLPFAWFPTTALGSASATPVLDAVLSGMGSAWAFCFQLLDAVRSQTRLATASGNFLDLLAVDFFGQTIARRAYEADDAFRARLSSSLLLPRATRSALLEALFSLTGLNARVFELRRSADAGGYGVAGFGYGSNMPFQYLVSLDANAGVIRRESVGSYLDVTGQLRIAPRHAARPVYANGTWTSFMVEPAGYNLLKDSVGFSGWSVPSAGAITSWSVETNPGIALWAGSPVLEMTVSTAGSFPGPSVKTFIGDQSVTASVWIWLPSGHTLTEFHLQCGDASGTGHVSADLTRVDQWQQLVTTLAGVVGAMRTVTTWLVGTSSGTTSNKILTQCWQLEPGTVATSFIPSEGQIGVRDKDRVVGDTSVNNPTILLRDDIQEVIGQTVPAGSIAWLNIQLRQ